jgi:hypothetical protein
MPGLDTLFEWRIHHRKPVILWPDWEYFLDHEVGDGEAQLYAGCGG